jgi:hypothetical protein
MTSIHVCKMNAIYFMHITGYNSLFLYNDTTFDNYFINELNKGGEYILLTEPKYN